MVTGDCIADDDSSCPSEDAVDPPVVLPAGIMIYGVVVVLALTGDVCPVVLLATRV